jgi:hypothetical protein
MDGGRCPCPLVDMTGSSMKGGRPTPTVVLLPIQLQTTSPKCQNPDARARREKLQLPGQAGRLRTGQANAATLALLFCYGYRHKPHTLPIVIATIGARARVRVVMQTVIGDQGIVFEILPCFLTNRNGSHKNKKNYG